MLKRYISTFFLTAFACSFGGAIFYVIIVLPLWSFLVPDYLTEIQFYAIIAFIFLFIVSYLTHIFATENLIRKHEKQIETIENGIEQTRIKHEKQIESMEKQIRQAEVKQKKAERDETL